MRGFCFFSSGVLSLLLIFSCSSASAQAAIDTELLQRISRSKSELQSLQSRISEKSRTYAQKLEQREREVTEARAKVAVQQRLADEQILSFEKLKERMEQWETQSNYQAHMLRHYQETFGIANSDQRHPVDAILGRLETALDPTWRPMRVITQEGRIVEAPVLKLGPVEIAVDDQARVAGLLVREQNLEPYILDILDSSAQKDIWNLRADGRGNYSFDPTLGNALQLREHGDGVLDHLKKGGVWAIPIVFFGLLSLLISILKASQFLRLPKVDDTLAEKLQGVHSRSPDDLPADVKTAYVKAGPSQRKLVEIALNNPVSQQRDDLLVANLMEHKHILEKYMGVVATSAAIAPLLGLLGTVSGMIDTFKMMTIFGSGDASTVSGGISEALITTELGLIVAIPSLIVSALLTRQIKNHTHRLENFAVKISKISFT